MYDPDLGSNDPGLYAEDACFELGMSVLSINAGPKGQSVVRLRPQCPASS